MKKIEEILKRGGDTDTNCCIGGGLLGAMVGFENIPLFCLRFSNLCYRASKTLVSDINCVLAKVKR